MATLQKTEILKMIIALKAIKISVSTIEKDLGFSNGLIGKAAKGTTELSDEKLERLKTYFNEKVEVKDSPIIKTKLVVDKDGLKQKPSNATTVAIRESMEKINKMFGPGTIMMFGDKPDTNYKTISTGSLNLDVALGIGGLPRGRIVEIFGMESSGKTTIALNVIADAQKQGLKCLLVDAENAFDPEYAAALGVDVENLQYCQPSCGEQGLEVADSQISSGEIGVVVIDSVAALIPKAELEGAMGDSKMGLHARLMSQACRKMVSSIAKTNTLVIFINQIRNKIGVMYGNPEVTTGGMALQFYASVRLEVKRSTTEKNSVMTGDIKQGNQTTVKVIKNKCAPPFRSAQFNIMYGLGIDNITEIAELGVEKGIIAKTGNTYTYNESKIGVGREQVIAFLKDNPAVSQEIEDKIRNLETA